VTFSTLFTAYLVVVAVAAVITARIWLMSREALATIAFLAVWLAFAGWLGITGVVGRYGHLPPGIALLNVPVLVAVVGLVVTGPGAILARRIPLVVLIGFQVYRVGVELCLHHLSSLGLAPRIMTLEGGNIEILVAASAPVAAWFVSRGEAGRRIAWVWNLIGILSLVNIVARAVLSAPGPLQIIDVNPLDTAILIYPFTFIPGFMAPLALALHLLAFRAFRSQAHEVART
jgi:hypothetical protein